MDGFTIDQLSNLQSLLAPKEEEDDPYEKPIGLQSKYNPGDIGPKKGKNEKQEKKEKDKNEIWGSDAIPDCESNYVDLYDTRQEPKYEIFYKQSVATEDIFLQLGNKNPTTASCECMVVRIDLPDTTRKDIDIDVKPQFLDLRTKKYRLALHLPNPVECESSNAEWDEDKCQLKVTMTNKREFDFMNF